MRSTLIAIVILAFVPASALAQPADIGQQLGELVDSATPAAALPLCPSVAFAGPDDDGIEDR